MSADRFDVILDSVIDDFYNTIINQQGLDNPKNVVSVMAKMTSNYLLSVDLRELNKITIDNKILLRLKNIIKKYVFTYAFTYIGFRISNYNDFRDGLIKYSIESRDTEYFTSESNTQTFSLIETMKRMVSDIEMKKNVSDTIQLPINLMDIVMNNNEKMWIHNVIKILLIHEVYLKNEKPDLAIILERAMIDMAETIYIEIVIPLDKSVDIINIEAMLSRREIDMGIAKNIYDAITKGEQTYKQQFSRTWDTKIMDMFNSGIVTPIVEDFLLYHKDNERYDFKGDNARKDKVKIKYILDKISTMENRYNDANRKASDDVIYKPLLHRMAITVNEYDDLKIISKITNISGKNIGEYESYSELEHIRRYPYINFKKIEKYGFSFSLNKTISVVRSVSLLEKRGRQIQLRVGNDSNVVNIIGLMFNPTTKPLECVNEMDIKETTNKFKVFSEHVISGIKKGSDEIKCWIFDVNDKDIEYDTYERHDKMETSKECKLMCAKLYDEIVKAIYGKIRDVYSEIGGMEYYYANNIKKRIEKNTMSIQMYESIYSEVDKYIYYNACRKIKPSYDKNEDIMYGLYGDYTKLPFVRINNESAILKIRMDNDAQVHEKNVVVAPNSICQHFIDWAHIMAKKRGFTAKYTEQIYDFTQKYVTLNDDEYICKSCGSSLDIHKYVVDGEYDEATQKFIPYNIPMNIQLEELPEYSKYNLVIRGIDGLINRIAENIRIPYLAGLALLQKINRTTMVKDTIDLLLINNSLLKKELSKHNENLPKYGVSKELTNLFNFELNNSIFQFTKDRDVDKDTYKNIKHNNIVAHIILLIILELDEGNVGYMSGDKSCNYELYEKYGKTILSGLKIIVNNKGDVKYVTNFPILSYILYTITCILSKYPIWNYDGVERGKNKINPVKQKIMAHTLIDLINCVMEFAIKHKKKHIYEIVYSKFNLKLKYVYSDGNLLQKIKSDYNSPEIKNDRVQDNAMKLKAIPLDSGYEPTKNDIIVYDNNRLPRYVARAREYEYTDIKMSNLTHCEFGKFHKYIAFENTLKCSECGTILSANKYNETLTGKIKGNANARYLEILCDKYCKSGVPHLYDEKRKCIFCDYQEGKYLPVGEMKELEAIRTYPRIMMINTGTESKDMGKVLDKYRIVDTETIVKKFVEKIQEIIGDTVKVGEEAFHINDDIYIIDHNNTGYPLQSPIRASAKDKTITFARRHHFFNRDVIIYHADKPAKIDVFYDMYTNVLIGYKEFNKDYALNEIPKHRIKIVYSLANKLMYLGSSQKYVKVDPKNKNFHVNLVRDRINNIKNTIHKFIIFLNMAVNRTSNDIIHADNVESPHKKNDIEKYIQFDVKKYYQKLVGLNTNNNGTELFDGHYDIARELYYESISTPKINENSQYVLIDDIYRTDIPGNILLSYFVSELNLLIELNNNYIRQDVTNFIVEFITIIFNEYNDDQSKHVNEVSIFEQMVNSISYMRKLEDHSMNMDELVSGLYEEYTDPDELKTKRETEEEREAKESLNAIDMDYEDPEDINDENSINPDVAGYTNVSKWDNIIKSPYNI